MDELVKFQDEIYCDSGQTYSMSDLKCYRKSIFGAFRTVKCAKEI